MAVIVASAVRLALQLRTRDLRLLLKRELVIAIAPLLAVPLVAWLVNTKLKNNRFLRLMEKDQALVAYQEATGQKDRQDAVRALEQHNWNLEAALRAARATLPARAAASRDRPPTFWRFLLTLIPQAAKEEWNPRTAVRLFTLQFEERWGARHPNFFEGSYREALSKAKQEYKFLLVYLHSDSHPNTPAFCRDVLCAERIVSFLNENFILWALSVSYPAGYEMSTTLGATSFPFLSLLDGYNMANGQHVVAEGPITADALLESLVLLMDEQGASLVAARAHNEEMIRNRMMMEEQNSEYMRSLEADQAKERQREEEERKQREEEARLRQEEERKRTEEEQKQLKRKMELERKQNELPPPPPADAKDVTSVVVRLPNGNRLMRKFNNTDLVKHIYDFVDLNSEMQPGGYHLVSSYPRQVYSNQELTLASAGLGPQAALLIQEL